MKRAAILFACLVSLASPPSSASELSVRLQHALQGSGTDDPVYVWIYLRDKGAARLGKTQPEELVSGRSLKRRAHVLPADALVDATDLPVEEEYVRELLPLLTELRHRSKWLNAVSATVTPRQLAEIQKLTCVDRIDLLARFPRALPPEETVPFDRSRLEKEAGTHSLDYGSSFNQVSMLKVPNVHDAGMFGQGIIVGVFDNGFRLLGHEALASLLILATHDFVDHKVDVAPINPSPSFGAHGVAVLSALAGYKQGTLIGPAFGATYLLARTENDSSETPVEEDNWVAAIEWADSLGVQVTSTSLGYKYYDQPYVSWTWEDMDGHTTVISRAATMAARKGIVVLNSAGNNGASLTQNTLNAPADADSILAVGAVNRDGSRASFSSVGPTTDSPPRIKPDIMAQGVQVLAASATDSSGYVLTGGTSLACPLAAGVATLLVQAKPDATPMEIIEALKATASNTSSPNNFDGWGIVDAARAINLLTGTDTITPGDPLASTFVLDQNYPNPFNPRTRLRFELPEAAVVRIAIFDILGREIRSLISTQRPAGIFFVDWDARDDNGQPVSSGTYIARMEASGLSGSSSVLLRKMLLLR
jgi:serine protease AprX